MLGFGRWCTVIGDVQLVVLASTVHLFPHVSFGHHALGNNSTISLIFFYFFLFLFFWEGWIFITRMQR